MHLADLLATHRLQAAGLAGPRAAGGTPRPRGFLSGHFGLSCGSEPQATTAVLSSNLTLRGRIGINRGTNRGRSCPSRWVLRGAPSVRRRPRTDRPAGAGAPPTNDIHRAVGSGRVMVRPAGQGPEPAPGPCARA